MRELEHYRSPDLHGCGCLLLLLAGVTAGLLAVGIGWILGLLLAGWL